MVDIEQLVKDYKFFTNHNIINISALKHNGTTNQIYKLSTDIGNYAIRVLQKNELDRELEYQIQQLTFENNISPKPVLFDRESRVMISSFVYGDHKERLLIDDIHTLALCLKSLHSLTIGSVPMTFDKYDIDIKQFGYDYVLCHNDLNPNNIIWNGKVTLIDWEYGGVNDRYFDLSSVIVEFNLNQKYMFYFLESYFDSNEAINIDKLYMYIKLYGKVCQYWWSNF